VEWLIGFGGPVLYIVTGVFLSRSVYRSRHKRGLTGRWDIDTGPIATLVGLFWPVGAPMYFSTIGMVKVFKAEGVGDLAKRFYNHNLPETLMEKQRRLEDEKRAARKKIEDQAKYIDKLERECRVGPYAELNSRT
jgi:hypothetical protein